MKVALTIPVLVMLSVCGCTGRGRYEEALRLSAEQRDDLTRDNKRLSEANERLAKEAKVLTKESLKQSREVTKLQREADELGQQIETWKRDASRVQEAAASAAHASNVIVELRQDLQERVEENERLQMSLKAARLIKTPTTRQSRPARKAAFVPTSGLSRPSTVGRGGVHINRRTCTIEGHGCGLPLP